VIENAEAFRAVLVEAAATLSVPLVKLLNV